jgi:hypothetical protein
VIRVLRHLPPPPIPSCTRCNTAEWHDRVDGTKSKSGKGNWFPLRGGEAQRAIAPDKETDEEPFLLHPLRR